MHAHDSHDGAAASHHSKARRVRYDFVDPPLPVPPIGHSSFLGESRRDLSGRDQCVVVSNSLPTRLPHLHLQTMTVIPRLAIAATVTVTMMMMRQARWALASCVVYSHSLGCLSCLGTRCSSRIDCTPTSLAGSGFTRRLLGTGKTKVSGRCCCNEFTGAKSVLVSVHCSYTIAPQVADDTDSSSSDDDEAGAPVASLESYADRVVANSGAHAALAAWGLSTKRRGTAATSLQARDAGFERQQQVGEGGRTMSERKRWSLTVALLTPTHRSLARALGRAWLRWRTARTIPWRRH